MLSDEQLSNKLIIEPKCEWFKYKPDKILEFPPLHYIKCSKIDVSKTIQLGGSYNIYCNFPKYFERAAIFEDQYMPYELDGRYFKVRNGYLLWPLLNLFAYTDLNDPNTVYISLQNVLDKSVVHAEKQNINFVGKFKFYEDSIELFEIDHEVYTSNETVMSIDKISEPLPASQQPDPIRQRYKHANVQNVPNMFQL